MSHRYHQSIDDHNTPYQSVDNYGSQANLHQYPASSGAAMRSAPSARPWYKRPLVKFGVPLVLVAAIAAGVVGGVVGSRDDDNSSSSGSGIRNNAAASNAAVSKDANGNPVYATSTTAAPAAPTTQAASVSCPADSPNYQQFGNIQVRTDHPRIFSTPSKWSCLPQQIAADAYLRSWNDTIVANATRFAAMDPVPYTPDGGLSGSGVLDVAREIQLRVIHWAFAYHTTNDTSFVDRTWRELQHAAGNGTDSFGADGTRWNPQHFLDVAEFTAAFGFAYDWLYAQWSDEQRNAIMWSIINLGLRFGLNSYTEETGYGWWQRTDGNWNCVCNGGLTLGALAIAHDDPTNTAQTLLGYTIPNAQDNCAQAVRPDGTWSETSDYWYFGTTGHMHMAASLLTATGSTQEMFSSNSNYNKTGLFHMYGSGFVEKFNYGDCGPNKFTATANELIFMGNELDIPLYSLYQRDRSDAPEPLAALLYNIDVSGDWWYDLPLDHYFNNPNNAWAAMRSSWTDSNGIYTAIKSGNLTGHQTHGNLDIGDFVIEALGQRWAGELCQDNYLSPNYFSNETQGSERWLYYRCMTEGQNTITYNQENQLVTALPTNNFDSTGDEQTSLSYSAPGSSAAYFWTDMGSAYNADIKRGMRLLNARRQILLQDEFTSTAESSQWRMHTNATITYSNGNRQANLALNGQNMVVSILDSAPSVQFTTLQPTRTSGAPQLPSADQDEELPNPGISVLAINVPAGTTTLEVLFNPQWSGLAASAYVTPSSVPLSSWSLTSHN